MVETSLFRPKSASIQDVSLSGGGCLVQEMLLSLSKTRAFWGVSRIKYFILKSLLVYYQL